VKDDGKVDGWVVVLVAVTAELMVVEMAVQLDG